jgi:hypothetical protein
VGLALFWVRSVRTAGVTWGVGRDGAEGGGVGKGRRWDYQIFDCASADGIDEMDEELQDEDHK